MEVKCIFCHQSLAGCPCNKIDSFFKGVIHIPKGGKPPVTPIVPLEPAQIIPLKKGLEIRNNAKIKNK